MTNTVIEGDSLEVMKDIPDKSIDLVLTDPPYGIDYQSARRIDKTQWKPKIANDKAPFTEWIGLVESKMKESARMLCFCRWDVEHDFYEAIKQTGLTVKNQIIWDKVIHGMGDLNGSFAPAHENIIYAVKGKYSFPKNRPSTIVKVPRIPVEKLQHPNEKPARLFEYFINLLTVEGNTVLDCFAGTGGVAKVCKKLNRNYILIEKEPKYVEIIRKRLAEPVDQYLFSDNDKEVASL